MHDTEGFLQKACQCMFALLSNVIHKRSVHTVLLSGRKSWDNSSHLRIGAVDTKNLACGVYCSREAVGQVLCYVTVQVVEV